MPSPRLGPASDPISRAMNENDIDAIAIAVHRSGDPGSTDQPATNSAIWAGGTRLRRRLSRIFHREIIGRRLRSTPDRVGIHGNSHHRICQSPRTHRCCRFACVNTFDG
jgi:hypothetical protein